MWCRGLYVACDLDKKNLSTTHSTEALKFYLCVKLQAERLSIPNVLPTGTFYRKVLPCNGQMVKHTNKGLQLKSWKMWQREQDFVYSVSEIQKCYGCQEAHV